MSVKDYGVKKWNNCPLYTAGTEYVMTDISGEFDIVHDSGNTFDSICAISTNKNVLI